MGLQSPETGLKVMQQLVQRWIGDGGAQKPDGSLGELVPCSVCPCRSNWGPKETQCAGYPVGDTGAGG
jgi:hypothetical protein